VGIYGLYNMLAPNGKLAPLMDHQVSRSDLAIYYCHHTSSYLEVHHILGDSCLRFDCYVIVHHFSCHGSFFLVLPPCSLHLFTLPASSLNLHSSCPPPSPSILILVCNLHPPPSFFSYLILFVLHPSHLPPCTSSISSSLYATSILLPPPFLFPHRLYCRQSHHGSPAPMLNR
jgi:hypothetical protein